MVITESQVTGCSSLFHSFDLTMDPCKTPHDDGHTPKVPGLQSCVLAAATLTIVGISDHDPRCPLGLEEEAIKEPFTSRLCNGTSI